MRGKQNGALNCCIYRFLLTFVSYPSLYPEPDRQQDDSEGGGPERGGLPHGGCGATSTDVANCP